MLEQKAARLYKLLGKSDTCALGMLQLLSRQWTNTLEEAYEHLLHVHFPECQAVRVFQCIRGFFTRMRYINLHLTFDID